MMLVIYYHDIHIKSINHARLDVPHVPSEASNLQVSMIEAMDDSLLLYSSIPLLLSMARHADRFQATYGWETEWRKSAFYAYNSPFYPNSSPTPTISIPSVDYANPSSPTTLHHDVRVVTSHTVFLRVPINQPDLHFQHIYDIISDFNFPLLHWRLPLTALRRLISQCLTSKIRPLLALQPLTPELAQKLDQVVAHKVHEYLGFPFHFNSQLLFTPLSLRGFDFPSLALLNSALAAAGVHQDLNHHIPPFCQMAHVTLSDWSCQLNGPPRNTPFPLKSASILTGEAYGIAAAYTLALHRHSHQPRPTVNLYTDHLASVKTITSPLHSQPHKLSRKPPRSIYRWIADLQSRALQTGLHIDLSHIKAHTTSSSPPAQLNRLADHAATSAQKSFLPIPPALPPTFHMDPFSPFNAVDGWIETDLTRHLLHALATSSYVSSPSLHHFSSLLYDHRAPPEFPYLRSTSSFSAVVQLYLRAHQLDTASRLSACLRSGAQPYCRFGCESLEDARHIFVRCPRFSSLREEANKTIVSATSTLFDVYDVPAQYQARALEHACTISHDSQSWPTGYTMYYYGVLPHIDDIMCDLNLTSLSSLKVERLRLRIAATWHTTLIRLAGRIWGIAKRASSPSHPSSPENHNRKSLITLPPHLSYISLLTKSQKFSIISST
ncbi:hypothetical protein D9615_008032 [Tricholomella constricta]|uniref:RNase H type-1 domain-containing protein n=1 Tax=Tricholomella constricta TaxID=117010 RepID=A0A8H5LZT2_9AGAR|nr:hypothetical protein D9615_008032 [Tricholomella constricta]